MGCGYNPCELADFETSGICVITNGYRVTSTMIDVTAQAVEKSFAWRGIEFDFVSLGEEYNLAAEFVDDSNIWLQPDNTEYGKNGYVGKMRGSIATVWAAESCVQYGILGHELIHFVAAKVMHISGEENCNHTTPGLWHQWDSANEDLDDSVEALVWVEIYHICDQTEEHYKPE